MEEFSQGWTNSRRGGYVDVPPEIILTIVFIEEPTQLLKFALRGYMFNKVTLDYGEGRSVEFEYVIVNRYDKDSGRYTIHMSALRIKIFVSEQEKKEFEATGLIYGGELFIGEKNKVTHY